MYKILLAEDSPEISDLIVLYLSSDRYQIDLAEDGQSALALLKEGDYDLLITDIMMPRMDGYDLIKNLRQFSHIPVLILSAKGEDHDKILGLNIGADDYITKPFNPLEITARVNAALRRRYQFEKEGKDIISHDTLIIDTKAFTVKKDGAIIDFTSTELKILLYLLESAGRIYSKEQISVFINGAYYETDDNSIIVHISNIRKKLGSNSLGKPFITTVRGLGYRIEKI